MKPHVAAGHDGYCTTLASYCPRRTLSDGCRSAQPDDFTRKPFTMVQHRHRIVRKFCHRRRHVRWYRQKRILRIQWDKRSDRSSHSLRKIKGCGSETCRDADAAVEVPAFRGVFAPVGEVAGSITKVTVEDIFAIDRIRRYLQGRDRSPFARHRPPTHVTTYL